MQDLLKFIGQLSKIAHNIHGFSVDLEPIVVPSLDKLEDEKVLDSKAKKITKHKVSIEHLIKWRHNLDSKAT